MVNEVSWSEVSGRRLSMRMVSPMRNLMFFFFQAEDGIRDLTVTGVQTCALPICPPPPDSARAAAFLDTLEERTFHYFWDLTNTQNGLTPDRAPSPSFSSIAAVGFEIGRASCRERV